MWAGQVGMGVAVDKGVSETSLSGGTRMQTKPRPHQGHTQTRIRSPYSVRRHADADMERRHTEYGKPTQESPPGQPSLTWRGVASSRRREARYKEDVESGSLH
ncbi:hypothetical protein MAJ_02572, partial [Metarhizium majus ARSEF 297]